MLNFISYGGVHYVTVAACLYSSTLAWKCYHHIGIKTYKHCIQTTQTLTKCLKFARVEIIQETQKSPFHFLDV